jgi:hypothetical protein
MNLSPDSDRILFMGVLARFVIGDIDFIGPVDNECKDANGGLEFKAFSCGIHIVLTL